MCSRSLSQSCLKNDRIGYNEENIKFDKNVYSDMSFKVKIHRIETEKPNNWLFDPSKKNSNFSICISISIYPLNRRLKEKKTMKRWNSSVDVEADALFA